MNLNRVLGGFRGDFYGEHSILNVNEPNGLGILVVSWDKVIVGYTENQGWNTG